MDVGSDRDDGVSWRFSRWDGEHSSVLSQVDGRILKQPEVTLVVTPRTGNSHEVGGKFPNYHLDLLVGRFPKDTCQDHMWHLGLDAVR